MLTEAVVSSSAENEKVLGTLDLRVASVVALRIEFVGVLVHVGVAQGHVCSVAITT